MHKMKAKVRATHLDLLGHVNNARFLEYLEWARWEWAETIGWDLATITREKKSPVVVHLSINFAKELTYPETISVHTRVKEVSTRTIILHQEIHKENGELAADAEIVWVLVDLRERKGIDIPQELRQRLLGQM